MAPDTATRSAFWPPTSRKAAAKSSRRRPGREPIAGLLASADPAEGEKVFKKCQACHTVDKGGPNKVGPALFGVVGNDIATHDGFAYSDSLQGLPGDWTYDALNHFLWKPKDYADGTKMAFAGLRKPEDRANIIAYLRAQDDSPEPLPEPQQQEQQQQEQQQQEQQQQEQQQQQ